MSRCPTCASENPPAARFCSNCGTAIPSSAEPPALQTAETRRVVTILFADLVGSTDLTERLDVEEARQVVGRFYQTVNETVAAFEGTVANLLGDAVLVVFGLPTAHEDDPERAVRAGLALRDALPVLNRALAASHNLEVQVRIGIGTGEVVARSGSTFDRDFLVSDAVTTAARIQQTIPPGAVVVADRTYRLTRHAIHYEELPPLPVKGKAAPLRVWAATAVRADRPGPETEAPLVGRVFELSLLRQFYARTLAARVPHLVTLLGQPGVGKSRLLREFVADLRREGPPRLLMGRSLAFGGQSYYALRDMLRTEAGLRDTDPPEAVRQAVAAWLAEASLDAEELLDGLLLTFGDTAAEHPEHARAALHTAWRRLLAALAARQPVLVAFEDLHWADEGLLDFVVELAGAPIAAPLYLVCLARPEILERRPLWGGGSRNAAIIEVPPLSIEETAQLVRALSRQRLAGHGEEAVAQRADGNPLFAEELIRMLTEDSRTAGVTVPDSVQAVLAARIDRLPADERHALQAAAVVGRTFWPSVVGRLVGRTPQEAEALLEALARKELVVRREVSAIAGEVEFAFRHILTRDVAYAMLPRAHRQRAHAQAAEWLEDRVAERSEEIVETLAEHLRLAGEDARAAPYLRRAAEKARRLYANADALRLYGQAIEAARRTGWSEILPSLYRERGEVHELLGAYAQALADFEAGLVAARERGDMRAEALLEHRIGFVHHREARLDEAAARFARAAELARALDDPRMLGTALVDLGTLEWDLGRHEETARLLDEAIPLLRSAGDRSTLARALNLLCMNRLALGYLREAVAAAQEAQAAAREAGDRSREATSLSYLAVVHTWMGDPGASLPYAEEAIALAEAIGDRRRATYAREFLIQAKMDLGDWGEAIALTEQMLPAVHAVTPLELPFVYLFLALIYDEIGAREAAEETYQRVLDFTARNPGWEQVIALAALQLARLRGDREALARALAHMLALKVSTFAPIEGWAMLPVALALFEERRLDDARAYLEGRTSLIERLQSNPAFVAGLHAVRALLALADGRRAEGERLFDEAITGAERVGHVMVCRRIRELRLAHLGRDEDREALRRLHDHIAQRLPPALRAIFLASPRVQAVAAAATSAS